MELTTGFVLDDRGRIVSTREPQASHGPLFTIVRSSTESAWAVHADVPEELAEQIAVLARQEPPVRDLRAAPVYAAEYLSLTGGRPGFAGPAFLFPETLVSTGSLVVVDDERQLQRHFRGSATALELVFAEARSLEQRIEDDDNVPSGTRECCSTNPFTARSNPNEIAARRRAPRSGSRARGSDGGRDAARGGAAQAGCFAECERPRGGGCPRGHAELRVGRGRRRRRVDARRSARG